MLGKLKFAACVLPVIALVIVACASYSKVLIYTDPLNGAVADVYTKSGDKITIYDTSPELNITTLGYVTVETKNRKSTSIEFDRGNLKSIGSDAGRIEFAWISARQARITVTGVVNGQLVSETKTLSARNPTRSKRLMNLRMKTSDTLPSIPRTEIAVNVTGCPTRPTSDDVRQVPVALNLVGNGGVRPFMNRVAAGRYRMPLDLESLRDALYLRDARIARDLKDILTTICDVQNLLPTERAIDALCNVLDFTNDAVGAICNAVTSPISLVVCDGGEKILEYKITLHENNARNITGAFAAQPSIQYRGSDGRERWMTLPVRRHVPGDPPLVFDAQLPCPLKFNGTVQIGGSLESTVCSGEGRARGRVEVALSVAEDGSQAMLDSHFYKTMSFPNCWSDSYDHRLAGIARKVGENRFQFVDRNDAEVATFDFAIQPNDTASANLKVVHDYCGTPRTCVSGTMTGNGPLAATRRPARR